MSDWFGEWDNSQHASHSAVSSSGGGRGYGAPTASSTRSATTSSSRHHQQQQAHGYDSDEDHGTRGHHLSSSSGGMSSARGLPSLSSGGGPAASASSNSSSVILSATDPALAPTDQVGGLAGPPMFQLERLDWKPTKEQGSVVGLGVGSGVLLIALANCSVIKWNVDTDEYDTIVISKRPDERIHKVFMDPTGNHGEKSHAHRLRTQHGCFPTALLSIAVRCLLHGGDTHERLLGTVRILCFCFQV